MHPTGTFLYNKEISRKLDCMKFKILNFIFLNKSEAFLAFIEIKHKIDFDATYFKLRLTIIKFPTLKTSTTSFTSAPYKIFRGIYLYCKIWQLWN